MHKLVGTAHFNGTHPICGSMRRRVHLFCWLPLINGWPWMSSSQEEEPALRRRRQLPDALSSPDECLEYEALNTTYNAIPEVPTYSGIMFEMLSYIDMEILTLEIDLRVDLMQDLTYDLNALVYTKLDGYQLAFNDSSSWELLANTTAILAPEGAGVIVPAADFRPLTVQVNERRSFYIAMNSDVIDSNVHALYKTGETQLRTQDLELFVGAGLKGRTFPQALDTMVHPQFAGVIHYRHSAPCNKLMDTTVVEFPILIQKETSPEMLSKFNTIVEDVVADILHKDETLLDFVKHQGLLLHGAVATEALEYDGECPPGWNDCPTSYLNAKVTFAHRTALESGDLQYVLYRYPRVILEYMKTDIAADMYYIGLEAVLASFELTIAGVPNGMILDESQKDFFALTTAHFFLQTIGTRYITVLNMDIDEQTIGVRRLEGGGSRQLQSDTGTIKLKGTIKGGQVALLPESTFASDLFDALREFQGMYMNMLRSGRTRPGELFENGGYEYFENITRVSGRINTIKLDPMEADLSKEGKSQGSIIGIAVGVSVGGVILLVGAMFFFHKFLRERAEYFKDLAEYRQRLKEERRSRSKNLQEQHLKLQDLAQREQAPVLIDDEQSSTFSFREPARIVPPAPTMPIPMPSTPQDRQLSDDRSVEGGSVHSRSSPSNLRHSKMSASASISSSLSSLISGPMTVNDDNDDEGAENAKIITSETNHAAASCKQDGDAPFMQEVEYVEPAAAAAATKCDTSMPRSGDTAVLRSSSHRATNSPILSRISTRQKIDKASERTAETFADIESTSPRSATSSSPETDDFDRVSQHSFAVDETAKSAQTVDRDASHVVEARQIAHSKAGDVKFCLGSASPDERTDLSARVAPRRTHSDDGHGNRRQDLQTRSSHQSGPSRRVPLERSISDDGHRTATYNEHHRARRPGHVSSIVQSGSMSASRYAPRRPQGPDDGKLYTQYPAARGVSKILRNSSSREQERSPTLSHFMSRDAQRRPTPQRSRSNDIVSAGPGLSTSGHYYHRRPPERSKSSDGVDNSYRSHEQHHRHQRTNSSDGLKEFVSESEHRRREAELSCSNGNRRQHLSKSYHEHRRAYETETAVPSRTSHAVNRPPPRDEDIPSIGPRMPQHLRDVPMPHQLSSHEESRSNESLSRYMEQQSQSREYAVPRSAQSVGGVPTSSAALYGRSSQSLSMSERHHHATIRRDTKRTVTSSASPPSSSPSRRQPPLRAKSYDLPHGGRLDDRAINSCATET